MIYSNKRRTSAGNFVAPITTSKAKSSQKSDQRRNVFERKRYQQSEKFAQR